MKIVLIIFGVIFALFFIFFIIGWLDEKSKNNSSSEFERKLPELISSTVALGVIGLIIWFVGRAMIDVIKSTPDDDGGGAYYYDEEPYGPGTDSNSSPGYHNVEGYYRSNGTYVEPYIRSNPDGNPYNNLNP